jgi:hypothetical protein
VAEAPGRALPRTAGTKLSRAGKTGRVCAFMELRLAAIAPSPTNARATAEFSSAERQGRMFFFEKKEQKTFVPRCACFREQQE